MKITQALVAEHNIFRDVFDEIERVLPRLTSLSEIQAMAGIVEGLLRRHAAHETNLAYLALDHVLAQAAQLDQMHHDHREIDAHFSQVHAAANASAARRLLRTALAASREHFSHEETVVFPLLENALEPETLLQLGQAWLERQPETVAEE